MDSSLNHIGFALSWQITRFQMATLSDQLTTYVIFIFNTRFTIWLYYIVLLGVVILLQLLSVTWSIPIPNISIQILTWFYVLLKWWQKCLFGTYLGHISWLWWFLTRVVIGFLDWLHIELWITLGRQRAIQVMMMMIHTLLALLSL